MPVVVRAGFGVRVDGYCASPSGSESLVMVFFWCLYRSAKENSGRTKEKTHDDVFVSFCPVARYGIEEMGVASHVLSTYSGKVYSGCSGHS